MNDDKYTALGKLAWLWMNSPLHGPWTVDLLSRFVVPPVELGQYILLERDDVPVAYCSWAFLSKEAELAYIKNPSSVRLADWNGGDHLWFIDWVAPFAGRDSWELRCRLSERFPDSVARAIRVKRNTQSARVMEFKGRNVDSAAARQKLSEYYQDFFSTLRGEGLAGEVEQGARRRPTPN